MTHYIKLHSKIQAKKAWEKGKIVYLQSCNMPANSVWQTPCPTRYDDYKLAAARWEFEHNSNVWEGNVLDTAWGLMYNNWSYYNTDTERGLYAHYYIAA